MLTVWRPSTRLPLTITQLWQKAWLYCISKKYSTKASCLIARGILTMTNTNTAIKNLLLSLNEKPIVIYPAYFRIAGDYTTAVALAQVLYWHKKMGRKFYKTDADFCNELALTAKQFVRVKDKLKSYDFLKITVEQIPAKTFYHVDYEKLAIALIGDKTLPPSPPPASPEKPISSLFVEALLSQKEETLPPKKVESNTENTQRLLQNNITQSQIQPKPNLNLSPVVVVELEKTFSNADLSASKKALATIPEPFHLQVLAVLMFQLTKQSIPNKIGYLCRLVSNVKNGTFTPVAVAAVPISVDERIKQEKIKREEEAKRGKVDNVSFFVEQVKRFGDKFKVPEQYQQAVFERLAV